MFVSVLLRLQNGPRVLCSSAAEMRAISGEMESLSMRV